MGHLKHQRKQNSIQKASACHFGCGELACTTDFLRLSFSKSPFLKTDKKRARYFRNVAAFNNDDANHVSTKLFEHRVPRNSTSSNMNKNHKDEHNKEYT